MYARQLQREQMELYAMEQSLLSLLPQIQEAANSLKVDELHLRSLQCSRAEQEFSVPFSVTRASVYSSSHATMDNAEHNMYVNKQEIDLDVFTGKLEHFDEENDSDTE